MERQQQIEHDMAARVVALLEPIVGAGRVRVNVSAQLDRQQRGRNRRAVGSHAGRSAAVRASTQTAAAALARSDRASRGTRANLPPDPKARHGARTTVVAARRCRCGHTAETTNYEVGQA